MSPKRGKLIQVWLDPERVKEFSRIQSSKELSTSDMVRLLLDQYSGHDSLCRVCGENPYEQYHHIVPRRLGGSDDKDNILLVCKGCHAEIHPELRDLILSKPSVFNNKGKKYIATWVNGDIEKTLEEIQSTTGENISEIIRKGILHYGFYGLGIDNFVPILPEKNSPSKEDG